MYKCYVQGVMVCPLSPKVEVFIEAIGPRISLRMITGHSVSGGPLIPYFLGGRGSAIDFDFSLTKKYTFLTFPITRRGRGTLGEAIPIGSDIWSSPLLRVIALVPLLCSLQIYHYTIPHAQGIS